MSPFVAHAVVVAREGSHDLLRDALLDLVSPTRAEEGNLSYDVFELAERPGTFIVRESFESQADLEAHKCTQHFRTFLIRSLSLMTGPIELTPLIQLA